MSTPAVTLDLSQSRSFDAPAQSLQGAVSYASQQDPTAYAKLLDLQRRTGIPPMVSQGNEKQVRQSADAASFDPQAFTTANPRTAAWGSNPDNAAVAGVDELHRVGAIEQNAAGMRASDPSWIERSNAWIRRGVQSITGKSTDQLQQDVYSFPLTRALVDVPAGVSGFAGNVASFFGLHGYGPTKQNFLQRIETALSPEENTDPASLFHKSNEFDWLAKNVAPFVPAMVASGGTSLLANTLKLSPTAGKVLAGLFVGGMFTTEQAGRTYTQVAGAGGSDGQARSAANRVAAINAIPNALFGATDVVSFLRDNPLLTSFGIGGLTGAAGQLSQNSVTGRPMGEGVLSSAVQGAAVQGGLHLGTDAFFGHLSQAVENADGSALKGRSPEKFQEAMQQVFQGDESLRIPADKFAEYFKSQDRQPSEVAAQLGVTNYAEATLSGGDVEVPKANFLSHLDPEHQRGLLPDVVDPSTGLTARQHQEGRDELQQWVSSGGPESLLTETAQADTETASSPEFQQVRDELHKRYTDAGETPEVADTLAEKDANVYANLARSAGMKPSELVAMYNPKVSVGETVPEGALAQEGTPESPRGWFKVNQDGSYEIGRTKIGDFSTFSHESAHAYLHVLGDLATRDGASEQLQSDHGKILDFLGVKPGEELTTEQQETWARANEQYLRDGKAPSTKLRGVFQRFSVWLRSVYSKASDLGVELSPDIRGVLDRLYAAEEGVDRAAADAGPRMFNSAEEAGWTEEQFQNYANANDVSVEQAKAHILTKLNEARLRESGESWREEKRNVREAVTAEIDQKPEYAAIRALRKGALDDGTALTMNREALVQQFGEQRVKELQKQHPGLYRTEGGLDPETAAEMLGYPSAETMVRGIQDSPRRSAAIEDSTRAYMTAKHGDIRYDGSLQEQAQIALENDRRAELLHKELTALKRRNNPEYELRQALREAKDEAKRQSLLDQIAALKQQNKDARAAMRDIEVAPIAAYREAASQMIEGKASADLQPTRYLDASRKYSREAFDALRRGKPDEAAAAKHKELLNHFLFREATEAKRYVERFESYARRMSTPGVQKALGLAGSDYRDQFNRILGRYGLGEPVQAGRSLAEWTEAQYADGKEPAIDPGMLNESRALNYRNAPIGEIRLVHDALVNIRQLAKLELGMEVNGRKIDFAAAVGNMETRARETMTAKPTRVLSGNRTLGERVTNLAQRGDALLMRTERLMEWLDGGKEGPWHDNLWHLAADAQGNEYTLQEQVTKRIGEAVDNLTKEQHARLLDKVTVDGIPETVTRHDLISMALNMGNEGNLDRLQRTFEAHGWDVGAVERVKNMLTPEEWKFVQGTWDSLKPLGEAQMALEKRLTGLPPVMVKPVGFRVDHGEGAVSDLDGGYFPIVMDPRYSKRGALQDASTTAQNMMEAGYGRATTSRGSMKERTGFGGPMLLDYSQVLTQHTAKVIKDITHREFMLTANKLLTEQNIRQTMRETLGDGYEEKMMPWLRAIVNDRNGSGAQGLGDFSSMMRGLRTNLTLAALSFKVTTSLLQWTHAPRMLLSTRPASYAQAMVDFMAHPSDMTAQIRELSPNEMAFRGDNIDRDVRETLRNSTGIRKKVAEAGNVSIKYTDHLLSFPLWLSVYRDSLKEHVDLPEERAQYLASHAADSAVRLGLGSGAPKDLPPIMRNNDLSKLLTMFYSFHNGIYGQVRDITHQYKQNGGVGKLTYGLALSVLVPSVLSGLVSGNGPSDGENKGLWAAKKALLFGGDMIPLVRDAATALERDGDVKLTPLVDVLSKGVKAAQQAGADKEDKDWTGIGLNALDVTGSLAGIPGVTQATKPLHYLHRVQQGQVDSPNAWNAIVGGAPHKVQ